MYINRARFVVGFGSCQDAKEIINLQENYGIFSTLKNIHLSKYSTSINIIYSNYFPQVYTLTHTEQEYICI